MDKLKPYLKVVKKYHFWIVLTLIVLATPAVWYYATSSLAEEKQKRAGEINTAFGKPQAVTSKTNTTTGQSHHPNRTSEDGMDEFIKTLRSDIAAAWQLRYDQQTDVLVWPKELREQFINEVKDLRPIEQKFPEYPTPDEKEIDIYYRELYQNYIEKELPKLAEKIGAVWTADASSTGNGRGGSGRFGEGFDGDVEEAVVEWDSGNQAEILTNHFTFDTNDDDPTPTTLEVLYAQEDLWVLQTLVDIIRRTNGDADAKHKAAVRRIDALLIGRSATEPTGMVTAVQPEAEEGETPAQPGAIPPVNEGGRVPPGEGLGEGLTGEQLEDPAEGRYVDLSYQPLPASKLRKTEAEGADPTKGNPEDAFLAVGKRVPIRMFLRMDQRKINKLLVECGNSALTVEVRQVRISRDGDLSQPLGDASAAPSSGRGGSFNLEGGRSGRGGSGRGGRGSGRGESGFSTGVGDDAFPYDVNVEIYGIVFIYNPVDTSVLALNLDSEGDIESADDVKEIQIDSTTTPTDEPADATDTPDVEPEPLPADDDAVTPEPVDEPAADAGQPAPVDAG
jgi:uncharacterized membrane protein YgcG